MRIWAAGILVITVSVALIAFLARSGGTEPASSDPVATQAPSTRQPPAASDTEQDDNAGPNEPAALVHRLEVLDRFTCEGCHGPEGGWELPQDEDHVDMDEARCRECHVQADPPPAIRVHNTMSEGTDPCGSCHGDIVGHSPASNQGEQRPCVECHVNKTEEVLPESHSERSQGISTCIVCHETQVLEVPYVPHSLEGWERCEFCHGADRLTPLVGAHEGGVSHECLQCHDSVRTPPGTNEGMLTHASEEGGCVSCHDEGLMAPPPEGHEDRVGVLCTLCHRPDGEDPTFVPHALTGRGDCTRCHSEGGVGPLPHSHADRNAEMCVSCHQELPGGPPDIDHGVEGRSNCTDCHEEGSDEADE